jgi:hypothetical protein
MIGSLGWEEIASVDAGFVGFPQAWGLDNGGTGFVSSQGESRV